MKIQIIIYGAISIIVGLVLIPLMSNMTWEAQNNTTVRAIGGLSNVLPLVMYGFAFGLVGIGIAMVVIGFKK